MKRITICTTIALLSSFSSTFAQTPALNCDSTCLGGALGVMAPQIQVVTSQKPQTVYGNLAIPMPPLTSSSSAAITYGTCPAGFNYYGSNQYPMSQQVTVTYTQNGQVVGTRVMPPQDLDNSCTAVQYQTVACPTGQTGSITQMRNVATGTGGYEYGGWTTTSNTCQVAGGTWTNLGVLNFGSPVACSTVATFVKNGSCGPAGINGAMCGAPDPNYSGMTDLWQCL